MNNRRKLVIALGANALSASLAALAQAQGKIPRIGDMVLSQLVEPPKPPINTSVTPVVVARNRTLVIFNTWAPYGKLAQTTDGYSSEQCADYYAQNRGYCTTGASRYFKLGADFTGTSYGHGTSHVPDLIYRTLKCNKSFVPGASPEVDNPRYTGRLISEAIKNVVADFGLGAVFVESLVPNMSSIYSNNAPDGRFFALCANPAARMPYGRLGFPGCTHADIVRMVGDANWAESQDNTGKPHVVGGTNYTAGGDSDHMQRAGASFATRVPPRALRAFDEDGRYAAGGYPGAGGVVNYKQFDSGVLSPPIDVFGLLFSRNPAVNTALGWTWKQTWSNTSWNPLRGGWAWDWCSGSGYVGYSMLLRGGCCAILNENEPHSNGIPATDYVAAQLIAGKTMAEANCGSIKMQVPNSSVYGVPDYAPYAIRKAPARPA